MYDLAQASACPFDNILDPDTTNRGTNAPHLNARGGSHALRTPYNLYPNGAFLVPADTREP